MQLLEGMITCELPPFFTKHEEFEKANH